MWNRESDLIWSRWSMGYILSQTREDPLNQSNHFFWKCMSFCLIGQQFINFTPLSKHNLICWVFWPFLLPSRYQMMLEAMLGRHSMAREGNNYLAAIQFVFLWANTHCQQWTNLIKLVIGFGAWFDALTGTRGLIRKPFDWLKTKPTLLWSQLRIQVCMNHCCKYCKFKGNYT